MIVRSVYHQQINLARRLLLISIAQMAELRWPLLKIKTDSATIRKWLGQEIPECTKLQTF